jgi:glycosyltransferase involved in cell wall biosynthesis
MVPAKGLDVLLEALRMLPAGVEWKLVLVGEGGERRRLEFLARDYGLKQQVAFMGPATRQQLSLFYSTADVFVFPSNEEPFGAVIPEAMAHGVPIVSTNVVGATADFVIDGHNGFVVSPKDPHALAAALATILSDSTLRRRMGENSRAIMGRHNVQQNATILLEAIRHGLRMQPKAVL